jgi:type VI secretion system protein
MAAASLFTRLAHAADPNSVERHTWRDDDVESAVAEHLRRMLNTRQGSCLTCPDYGLIEVSEVLFDFPDAIGIMQRAIKSTIQTYEPRLKNVQVRHIQGDEARERMLAFEISAQLHLPDGRRQTLYFATSVDPNGNVKVGG